ncbi:replication factor C, subunit 4, putative [Cryptosporidium muris RN66]|uniref:Replication factor C, subunit 4, putative n=1 Tax=Cryptosporidium muris (strain RN66) TaxID=441375 RepID=B6ABD9_CRYMR|nr:replication factor C, subunit 4, putative [Cryptosporidium muris RN66]EEA05691.1 replication factor C, subunit 4, putative [Cryptosporidium muris RN66]|eukprot:XP_002140040.1 replication factor C, subunit 4 [Cryptosporidium muris RN66]
MSITQNNNLWVEKYRPRQIADIYHQTEVVKMLKNVLEFGNMPHLLFYGPPGTGKTSAILALCRELFGNDEFRNRTLELNASDERGINVVREKIKTWTRQVVYSNKINPITGRKIPPWKVVILDEAEMMTSDAQSALRRIIETSAKNTRFVIICNYINKIIEPLASRCAKFRFQPISFKAQRERLNFICQQENIICEPEVFDILVDLSQGDLRRAITILQSTCELYSEEEIVKATSVIEVAGIPPLSVAEGIMNFCFTKDIDSIVQKTTDTINEGWDVATIIRQLVLLITENKDLDDAKKAYLALRLAEADACITDGSNEFLILLNICSNMHSVMA